MFAKPTKEDVHLSRNIAGNRVRQLIRVVKLVPSGLLHAEV
jgi:hypothetical protein